MATGQSGDGPLRAQNRIFGGQLWARVLTRPGLGSIGMVPGNNTMPEASTPAAGFDAESAEWLRALADAGPAREAALGSLHELLVRIAHREVARRGQRLAITGPELDDLAYQAAADALVAITGKIGQFRGESRFTTWAYKFVILEVSAKIGRHFWLHPAVPLDAEDWDRLPARFGADPAHQAEWGDLFAALRRAVNTELSPRQREVFIAIVLNDVPLDTLVLSLASSRNAIYKMMFDARRKLRASLAAKGYLPDDSSRRS
jgi:RNA polymerase sigma-70 factor, ECF subfamily